MHSRVPVFVFVALVLPIAAATTAFAAPVTDACSVLTAAQVSAALGSPVASGTYITPTFKTTCTWTIPTGGAVTLQLMTIRFFNAGKGALAAAETESTSGVGDEAYYHGLGSTIGLVVRKGGAAFKIAVYSRDLTQDKRKAIERALAQLALSKF